MERMVERSQELHFALGNGVKKVEDNEKDTVIVQRRSIRFKSDIIAGEQITREHLECLRPCPADGIEPYHLEAILGRTVKDSVSKGEYIKWNQID